MNILDNLLLILLVAAFLFYCYKKKKFPFRRKGEGMDTPEKTGTPPDGAQYGANIPGNLQMLPYGVPGFQNPYTSYLQSIQNLQGMGSQVTGAQGAILPPQAVSFCKVIPWTFRYDPLPFADSETKNAAADNTVADEMPMLGLTLNNEICTLNASGLTVTGISVTAVPLGECVTRVLFVITCSGAEYPAAAEH